MDEERSESVIKVFVDLYNKEMLEKVLGTVRVDPGILAEDSHVRPKAPGMRYKHYAPKADLTIIQGEMERVIPEINRLFLLYKTTYFYYGLYILMQEFRQYRLHIAIPIPGTMPGTKFIISLATTRS